MGQGAPVRSDGDDYDIDEGGQDSNRVISAEVEFLDEHANVLAPRVERET